MAPAAALDLAAVRQLTNLNEVNRLLHDANAKERAINAELELLLGKRGELEDGLLVLHQSTAEASSRAELRSGSPDTGLPQP